MPLNSTPCTVTAKEVVRKRAALEAAAVTDFGLWGGLVPGALDDMAGMAEEGVVGFKAFMCDSGLPEFPAVDEETLAAGMTEAARLRLPVAVHAEDEAMTRRLAAAMTGTTARDYLASRPVDAEVLAIARAVDLAAVTGVRLHLVHVSSGSGVAKALEAKARGVDVTIETCPHYLYLTDEDPSASAWLPSARLRSAMTSSRMRSVQADRGSGRHHRVRPFADRSCAEATRRLPGIGRHRRRAINPGGAPERARWPAPASSASPRSPRRPASRFGLCLERCPDVGKDADLCCRSRAVVYFTGARRCSGTRSARISASRWARSSGRSAAARRSSGTAKSYQTKPVRAPGCKSMADLLITAAV
jgi:hypothetical protein